MTDLDKRLDSLSDGDRAMLVRELLDSHPRIAEHLLDRVDLYHRREAAREAMPPHPFTTHPRIAGLHLCHFHHGGASRSWCTISGRGSFGGARRRSLSRNTPSASSISAMETLWKMAKSKIGAS